MNKLPSDMKLTIHSAHYSDWHPLISCSKFRAGIESAHMELYAENQSIKTSSRLDLHAPTTTVHFHFSMERKSWRIKMLKIKFQVIQLLCWCFYYDSSIRSGNAARTKLCENFQFALDPNMLRKRLEQERKVVTSHRYWCRFVPCLTDTHSASSRAIFLFFFLAFFYLHAHRLMLFFASHSMMFSAPLCLRNSSLRSIDPAVVVMGQTSFYTAAAAFRSNWLGSQLEFPFCGFFCSFILSRWGLFANCFAFFCCFVLHEFMAKNKTFRMASALGENGETGKKRLCAIMPNFIAGCTIFYHSIMEMRDRSWWTLNLNFQDIRGSSENC